MQLDLDLYIPGHPFESQIKRDCEDKLQICDWIKKVTFVVPESIKGSVGVGTLSKVRHSIAVSSCKGITI